MAWILQPAMMLGCIYYMMQREGEYRNSWEAGTMRASHLAFVKANVEEDHQLDPSDDLVAGEIRLASRQPFAQDSDSAGSD